jgi:NAD+ kinase
MNSQFKRIALIARQNRPGLVETLQSLVDLLRQEDFELVVEEHSAQLIPNSDVQTIDYEQLGAEQDLIIVIGGDGSLLNAAKAAAKYNTPVLGINRGTLGFLTDINPSDVPSKIIDVLEGNYTEEERFFLHMRVHEGGETVAEGLALNEVVLLPGEAAAQMIQFDIRVNHEFVCHQRSDGLIVATPTGSTAYALSAGGPIIKPDLNAIVMVPMFPHTLSMRPILINADNRVKITIDNEQEAKPRVSCDGNAPISIPPGGHIHIDKSDLSLRLLHPAGYNYFQTLRGKLRWGEKLC